MGRDVDVGEYSKLAVGPCERKAVGYCGRLSTRFRKGDGMPMTDKKVIERVEKMMQELRALAPTDKRAAGWLGTIKGMREYIERHK
jgi:methyl coenzyme M reductase subunit C-like uncharacterized protein (methanogenesis marker protein 7)